MFDNEVMVPGEKIKKIRHVLKATQGEIADGICTRNNISNIENNKQNLSSNLAIGIAKNLNEIAKKKGIYLSSISALDLIKDENSQACIILRNSIERELKEIKEIDSFDEKLSEMETIIKRYTVSDNEKLQLYKLAANFYYDKCAYFKSDEMCNKAINICIYMKNNLDEGHLYINKARIYTEMGLINESLDQLMKAEKKYNDTLDNELFKRLYYNKALAYKKLCNYDEALAHLEILLNRVIEDNKMFVKAKMLHANCLMDQGGNFKKAKKEYIEIIKIANKDFICMAYRNLSELYFNEGEYKTAAKYINKSIQNHSINEYLGETLYFAAKIFRKLNEDIEEYLLKALDTCEKNDRENLDLIEKIIYELVLIYIQKEDETSIMLMDRKSDELKIDCSLIYLEIAEYYAERNTEKSVFFNRKLKNKIKFIKKR